MLGIFCLFFDLAAYAQQQQTVSGYLKDASNGEALIGASVIVKGTSSGTISNVYGFYSFTLPAGTYQIDYRYVGFGDLSQEVVLTADVRLDLELVPAQMQLQEIVVSDKAIDENVQSIEMSVAQLDIQSIQKMPAFAGEVDILKSIQLLPGVSTVGEGASGFNVRGGSVGQNLVLLDEAPVYQSSHMFGFFSVFNPDAVRDVKLYKGGIPSKYGGRLASILDVRMKEGNNKEYDVTGGLGTIFSRLAVEGPIKKDKSSFIVAGRRSYADVVAKAFTDALSDGMALYFYDLTAKTNFNIDKNNRVFLSGYFGRDVFRFDKFQGFDWGNRTATLRWNHVYNSRLFSNYSLFYSNYNYGFLLGESNQEKYDWKSYIDTYNFKPEYSWFMNANNEVNFGAEAILYQFDPANIESVSGGVATDISLDQRKALETSLYVGNDQHISDRLSAQYGLRYSMFSYLGGTVYHYGDTLPGIARPLISTTVKSDWNAIQTFRNLEPRVSFRYAFTKASSVKASYNRMNQYIHLISNTAASLPIDVWQPSNNNLSPQQGDQVALGYFRNFSENAYETSAEVYYKWTQNQVDYIDGADIFANKYLESQLLAGVGRAYGFELYVKKNTGRLNGWVSYSLGKTELRVDGINYGMNRESREGEWYPTRFDQRHNLKVTTFYELSPRVSLSANFCYISGTPTTFPTDRITVAGYVIPYIGSSDRNNFRIPDYHRLDISATFANIWRGKRKKSGNIRAGEDDLVVSVYNLYARQNPFSIYFSQGADRQPSDTPLVTSATQMAMIGTLIPAVSYNFKF